jgi:hypothetical protein
MLRFKFKIDIASEPMKENEKFQLEFVPRILGQYSNLYTDVGSD